MTVDLDILVRVIENIATKHQSGEDVSLREEFRDVPVPVRAFLAAVILAAADCPLTGKNLALVGTFSRGSTLRDYGDLMARLRDSVPSFVEQARLGTSEGQSVETLMRELHQRDVTIAELRAQVKEQHHDFEVAVSYARDLHERYREELEEDEKERATKVRTLRPLDD